MNYPVPQNFTALQRCIPILLALMIAAATIELIRRRKLKAEFALLWILISVALVVFAAFPQLLWIISMHLGVFYLTVMFLGGFGFLSMVAVHQAMVISRLSDSNREVAQRVALLQQELDRLRGNEEPPHKTNDQPAAPAG